MANVPGDYSALSVILIMASIVLMGSAISLVVIGWTSRVRRSDIDQMRMESFRLRREISTLRLLLYFSEADRKRRLVLLKQTDPGKHHDLTEVK